MSRVYTVEFENQSITTAGGSRDFFYLAPATNLPLEVLGFEFAQFSDVGDAAEEILRLRIIRGHTTVGSGGSAATARPLDSRDAAASGTFRTNDTTIASAGTPINLWSGGFNVRQPSPYIFPEEYRPRVDAGQTTLVVRLMAAPADDVTMSGTLWFKAL